jgi:hypothetical protein
MIWNLKRINEEIDAELAKIDAILAIAAEENRDPTAEEAAEIDAIQGTENKPGTLQKLQADRARAMRLDAIKAANLGRHIGGQQVGGDEPGMVAGIEAPEGNPSASDCQATRARQALHRAPMLRLTPMRLVAF